METDGQNEQHVGGYESVVGAILEGTPLVADGREGIRGLELLMQFIFQAGLEKISRTPD